MYFLALLTALYSCKSTQNLEILKPEPVVVNLNLVHLESDKVKVTVDPGKFTQSQTTFYISKIVPGTYSIDNYGEFIENLKAFDYLGTELFVAKTDKNSRLIDDVKNFDKITYWVNNSDDVEGEEGVFSPAGTNIEKDKNFMLNLHGFVGYFDNLKEQPYHLFINRPTNLIPGTSMPCSGSLSTTGQDHAMTDIFKVSRYFEVIDNPIMYAALDT